MKKTILLTSLCSLLSFAAFGADMPQPPMNSSNGHGPRGDMMMNLSEEQKTCIESYGCPKMERPGRPENGEQPDFNNKPEPGVRPEMTSEQRTAMDCMRKAMESCGVQMPTPPERPNGEGHGPHPDGDRPEHPDK